MKAKTKTGVKAKPKKNAAKCDEPRETMYKWSDDFYVLAYRLAKQGLPDYAIAQQLGVTHQHLLRWLKRKPSLANALAAARDVNSSSFQAEFRDYVYARLPDNLKEIWDELNRCERKGSGVARLEALLEKNGKRARQHLFMYALVNCNFNPSEACRRVNVSKQVLDGWIKNDPDFSELMDQIQWHKGNFFEEGLVKLVREGDTKAIVFANERFNKSRGYGNKVEVNHSGQVNHLHAHMIDLEGLELPSEIKMQILEAVRKQRPASLPLDVESVKSHDLEEDEE